MSILDTLKQVDTFFDALVKDYGIKEDIVLFQEGKHHIAALSRESDPQPTPHGIDISIFDIVIGELNKRRDLGISKYGEELRPFNGRDARSDFKAELYDAIVYMEQEDI